MDPHPLCCCLKCIEHWKRRATKDDRQSLERWEQRGLFDRAAS
jgi:hypothetical protein